MIRTKVSITLLEVSNSACFFCRRGLSLSQLLPTKGGVVPSLVQLVAVPIASLGATVSNQPLQACAEFRPTPDFPFLPTIHAVHRLFEKVRFPHQPLIEVNIGRLELHVGGSRTFDDQRLEQFVRFFEFTLSTFAIGQTQADSGEPSLSLNALSFFARSRIET